MNIFQSLSLSFMMKMFQGEQKPVEVTQNCGGARKSCVANHCRDQGHAKQVNIFSIFFQFTTALVFIHDGISETSSSFSRGNGLFNRTSVYDAGQGVPLHSPFQMENDQIYGIFYVYFLFHFCSHHIRI